MENKRGIKFLGNAVFWILIAVFSIGILVLLITSLIGIFTSKTEIEQTRAVLNDIEGVIDGLEDEETREINIVGGPSGKYLVGWSNDELDYINEGQNKPEIDGCFSSSCICICDKASKTSCQKTGICLPIEEEVLSLEAFVSSMSREFNTGLSVTVETRKDTTLNCVQFTKSNNKAMFNKKEAELEIFFNAEGQEWDLGSSNLNIACFARG